VGPEDAKAFADYFGKEALPFIGLPDPTASALKLYEQEVNLFKLGRMPAQVLIDKAGVARYVYYGHSMSDIPKNEELLALAHTRNAAEMAAYNPNYIGGDINGGVQDLRQLFTRPVASLNPYVTPASSIYLCSSSTPPGGGGHGMCGYWAAQAALRAG
jgi:hypothetical protein